MAHSPGRFDAWPQSALIPRAGIAVGLHACACGTVIGVNGVNDVTAFQMASCSRRG